MFGFALKTASASKSRLTEGLPAGWATFGTAESQGTGSPVLPFRFNSLSGILPCSSSQIAKAAFTSISRRSVTACSLVKEPLAMSVSIRPRSTTAKAASWPLISGSLVGNKSNCLDGSPTLYQVLIWI